MAERVWRRVVGILDGDPSLSELYATLPGLIWGLVLLLSSCTFCTSATYGHIGRVPEQAWGALFLAHAVVAIGAWLAEAWTLRRLSMMAAVWIWTTVLVGLIAATPATTAWVYVTPAIAALIASVQLSGQRPPIGEGRARRWIRWFA